MNEKIKSLLYKRMAISTSTDDWNCYEDCKKIIRKFEQENDVSEDFYFDAVNYVVNKLEL